MLKILIENTLHGAIDKVEIAIQRLKSFEEMALKNNPNGYYVCDSGGKDSSVIKELCRMAGVKFEIAHNHTTADHPETVYFVREERKRWENLGYIYSINYPTYKGEPTSIWKLIPIKTLPTRFRRWCCEVFKEHGGENRFVITGVRWAESVRRKTNRAAYETFTSNIKNKIMLNNDNDFKRKLTENCVTKGKIIINPIIDWQDEDVYEFIQNFNTPYNVLYDRGYKRIGCVGCPLRNNLNDLESNPKYKNMYLRAMKKMLKEKPHLKEKYGWESEIDIYKFWTEAVKVQAYNENQISIFDEEN